MRFGVDRAHCCAMVQYESNEIAKEALTAVKGTYIENSRRLLVRAVQVSVESWRLSLCGCVSVWVCLRGVAVSQWVCLGVSEGCGCVSGVWACLSGCVSV